MNNLEIHQESGSEHSRRMKGLSRQAESNDIKFKRSTRRSNKKKKLVVKTGRWEKKESIAFLKGFRLHGKGKWKQIAKSIPTRTTVQVKTHAQMILKKLDAGEDVFSILEDQIEDPKHPSIRNCKNEETTSTTTSRCTMEDSFHSDQDHMALEINSSTTSSSTSINSNDSASLPPLLDCLEVVTNFNSPMRGMPHSASTLECAAMATHSTSLSPSSGGCLKKVDDFHHENNWKNSNFSPNNNGAIGPDKSTNDKDLQGAALLLLNFSSSPMRSESSISYNILPPRLNESMSSSTLSSTGESRDIGSTTSDGNANSTDLSSEKSNHFKVALDPMFTHEVDFSMEANNCTAV